MHIPARRRPDFEQARRYEYPTHLREAIVSLPSAPGVYVFHGEEDALPLYIGKSVNLRSRVLSHLRNVDEASLLRQTRRISHIRTVGEMGALLLEASLIKQQQPLMNQRLRRLRQLCSLRIADGQPEVVYSSDLNFATEPKLYGLFSSRHAALEALRNLADQHRLCYGALGLEKLKPGRACFRAMLKQCDGVCRGDESEDAHRSRLFTSLEGLSVARWPYPGAIGLVERYRDDRQIHVIRNWCYLGSVSNVAQAGALDVRAAGFDADGYKIPCQPLLSGGAEIILLRAGKGALSCTPWSMATTSL
ncbi:MAG: excinuclease Cho [Burkholderiaceae bacterium]|nr:excinuclease Cho [Burkholderiaceae bacterium]